MKTHPCAFASLLLLWIPPAYSDIDLEFGRIQIERMLDDMPMMRAYPTRSSGFEPIIPSSTLYQWITRQFAGESTGWPIMWRKARFENNSTSAYHLSPTENRPGVISVVETYWDEKNSVSRYYGFEALYSALIYEFYNIRTSAAFRELQKRVAHRGMNRDQFLEAMARLEHSAGLELMDFYETVWKPWADTCDFEPDISRWNWEPDFECWLTTRVYTGYPEVPYASYFDELLEGGPTALPLPVSEDLLPDPGDLQVETKKASAKETGETRKQYRQEYGQRQVRNMLKDRPAMAFAPILGEGGLAFRMVRPEDPIYVWMARAFGGDLNGDLIAWNDDEPAHEWASKVQIPEFIFGADSECATGQRMAFIRISSKPMPNPTFEDFWRIAVEQVIGLARESEKIEIGTSAQDGSLSQNEYIQKCLLVQFEIEKAQRKFFNEVFMPRAAGAGVRMEGLNAEKWGTMHDFDLWLSTDRAEILMKVYERFYTAISSIR